MWLFALFVVIPIVEIGLFIQVGGWIGLWPTLALVIAMAALGSWLLRRQGLAALADVQRSVRSLDDPLGPLAHGMLIVFAALLMITPGFFTDLLGLALLLRPVRALVLRGLASRIAVAATVAPRPFGQRGAIIEGDFHEMSAGRDESLPPPPDRPRH